MAVGKPALGAGPPLALDQPFEIRAPGWGPRLREAGLSLIGVAVWCVLIIVADARDLLLVALATSLFWFVKGLVRRPFPGDVILQADARGLRWWGRANGDVPWADVEALLPSTRNAGILLIDSHRRAHRLPRLPGHTTAEVIAEIEARRPPS